MASRQEHIVSSDEDSFSYSDNPDDSASEDDISDENCNKRK